MKHESIIHDFVRATQIAAISAHEFSGKGNGNAADFVAVRGMREEIDKMNVHCTVSIGEGARDDAPMLYFGEQLGKREIGMPRIDIAVDPLEGTNLCAHWKPGAMSVLACSGSGIMSAPDIYMDKIAVGCDVPKGTISLDNNIKENLNYLAQIKNKTIDSLVVSVLNRDRHKNLIHDIRECGSRIKMIDDGDISACLETTRLGDVDMYIGIGGAPEGVISAIALQNLSGFFEGRFVLPENVWGAQQQNENMLSHISDTSEKILKELDYKKIYTAYDFVKLHDACFIATGVTHGDLMRGVQCKNSVYIVDSIIISPHGCSKICQEIDCSIQQNDSGIE